MVHKQHTVRPTSKTDKLMVELPNFDDSDEVKRYFALLETLKVERYGVKKLLRSSLAYVRSIRLAAEHLEVMKGTLKIVNGKRTEWQYYRYEEGKLRTAAQNFYATLNDNELRMHAAFLIDSEMSQFDVVSLTRDELFNVMVDLMVEKKLEEKYGEVEELKSKRSGDVVVKERG